MAKGKKQRRSEKIIPLTQLAFVVDSRDPWDDEPPSKEDIARAHFENRQQKRDYLPVTTSRELRYAVEWPSVVKNVTVPYYQNESQDTSQALCGRSLVSTTVSTNPSCSTAQIDVAAFEQTTRELVGRAANMKTRFWLKFCVVWPLGPQDIRRIHRENINFNKRRCEYLTFNNTPTAYLLIDSDGDPEYTKNIIRRKLGSAAAPSPPILLAAPNSGYAIRFRHGEEMPTLIQKSSESQFALVFDEKYTEFTKCSARVFYERLLRCPLRFDRKLEQSEKLWIQ